MKIYYFVMVNYTKVRFGVIVNGRNNYGEELRKLRKLFQTHLQKKKQEINLLNNNRI